MEDSRTEDKRSSFPPLESWSMLYPPPEEPKQRGITWLAWTIILVLVTFTIVLNQFFRKPAAVEGKTDQVGSIVGDKQSRYLVGAANLLNTGKEEFLNQLAYLKEGNWNDKFRYVVFVGEIDSPEKALEELNAIGKNLFREKKDIKPAAEKTYTILQNLYTAYSNKTDPESLSAEQSDLLKSQLGWAGQLALVPPTNGDEAHEEARSEVLAEAYQTFIATLLLFVGSILFGVGGFILLVFLIIFTLSGYIGSRLFMKRGTSGIYAETFAVYLLLFWILQLGLRVVLPFVPVIPLMIAAMFLSLLALAWPVIRGIPWSTVRQEIGLTFGKNPLKEIVLGPATYIMSLTFLMIGILIMLGIIFAEKFIAHGGDVDSITPDEGTAHPIIGFFTDASWLDYVMIFFLASVAAPIVEEIMFRGVIHRHLRESTGKLGIALSFLLSSLIGSFIFAAVHPQGLIAIPALMGLAIGFTIAREIRGSLIPCMIAHGINNGLIICFLIISLGG